MEAGPPCLGCLGYSGGHLVACRQCRSRAGRGVGHAAVGIAQTMKIVPHCSYLNPEPSSTSHGTTKFYLVIFSALKHSAPHHAFSFLCLYALSDPRGAAHPGLGIFLLGIRWGCCPRAAAVGQSWRQSGERGLSLQPSCHSAQGWRGQARLIPLTLGRMPAPKCTASPAPLRIGPCPCGPRE